MPTLTTLLLADAVAKKGNEADSVEDVPVGHPMKRRKNEPGRPSADNRFAHPGDDFASDARRQAAQRTSDTVRTPGDRPEQKAWKRKRKDAGRPSAENRFSHPGDSFGYPKPGTEDEQRTPGDRPEQKRMKMRKDAGRPFPGNRFQHPGDQFAHPTPGTQDFQRPPGDRPEQKRKRKQWAPQDDHALDSPSNAQRDRLKRKRGKCD